MTDPEDYSPRGFSVPVSKGQSLSRQWKLRPAARALWAHWQTEKCFAARTCRAGKQTELYFAAVAAKLYEVFSLFMVKDMV